MKYSWLALLFMVLSSCSQKEHAGTTSETENDIAVRITLQDGSPVASAKVWLIDAEHYDSLIALGKDSHLDSAETDKYGKANLVYHGEKVQVSILARKPGFAGLVRNYQNADSSLTVVPSGQISGTVDLPTGSRVLLDGTGLSAEVQANGEYSISDVPQGYFGLLLQVQGQEPVFSSAVVVDSSMQVLKNVESNGFLLEDFDDGDALPLLHALGAGAAWYVYRDGVGTLFEPAEVESQITSALQSSDAWQGRSLNLKVHLDSEVVDAYGSLACKLGVQGGAGRADLSELDSISFWMKGSGQVRIAFASDYIHTHYPVTQAYADLGFNMQVPAEWTRITIPVDSLLPPENSEPWTDGVTWTDVAKSIDLFIMGTWDDSGQTVEFSVDEIRFHGVSHTTFR